MRRKKNLYLLIEVYVTTSGLDIDSKICRAFLIKLTLPYEIKMNKLK